MNEIVNHAHESSFIIDIPKLEIGQQITVTGIVEKHKKFSENLIGVWLRDITGQILAILDLTHDPVSSNWNPRDIWTGTRLKISAKVALNKSQIRILKEIQNIEVLVSATTTLPDLSEEMREHASSMLMSRISHSVAYILQNRRFTQFVSRSISHTWQDEGLEPMQVIYPGFGAPAYLTTSPSAQVLEFLTNTLLRRAFTISTSFTQTYRFSDSAAETQVVVAKALDFEKEDQVDLFREVSNNIFDRLLREGRSFARLPGVWPDLIDGVPRNRRQLEHDLNLIEFTTNIPVIGGRWDTQIEEILQLLDKEGNLLAEGTRERLSDEIVISSLTVYPSQYLGVVEKSPRRQLRNLMGLYDGKKK